MTPSAKLENVSSISPNGTGQVIVTSDLNLVATPAPVYRINGVPLNFVTNPAGANGQIQYNNAGDFGAANLYWDNTNARLGIGTATPQALLDVGGRLTWDNNNRLLTVGTESGVRAFLWGGVYGNFHQLDIDASPLNLCREDQSNGMVGIGLGNPQYKLDVLDSINITVTATSELPPTQPGPGNSWSLSFSNRNILATDQRVARISVNTESFIDSGVLMFQTANAGVMGERMRIDSQGRVGIGTVTPQAALDVAGDVNTTGRYAINDVYGMRVESGTLQIYRPAGLNSFVQFGCLASGNFYPTAQVETAVGGITSFYSTDVGGPAVCIALRQYSADPARRFLIGTEDTRGDLCFMDANGVLVFRVGNQGNNQLYCPRILTFPDLATAQGTLGAGTKAIFADNNNQLFVT